MTAAGKHQPGFRTLDPLVAKVMKMRVAARTNGALMTQFGVSYNAWRKIEANIPIRASLAERIERKVRSTYPEVSS